MKQLTSSFGVRITYIAHVSNRATRAVQYFAFVLAVSSTSWLEWSVGGMGTVPPCQPSPPSTPLFLHSFRGSTRLWLLLVSSCSSRGSVWRSKIWRPPLFRFWRSSKFHCLRESREDVAHKCNKKKLNNYLFTACLHNWKRHAIIFNKKEAIIYAKRSGCEVDSLLLNHDAMRMRVT